jgi:hypothetical protein
VSSEDGFEWRGSAHWGPSEKQKGDSEMIGRLLSRHESNAALVVALSGAGAVLVATGGGPHSAGKLLSAVLSNPVPRTSERSRSEAPIPAPGSVIAT